MKKERNNQNSTTITNEFREKIEKIDQSENTTKSRHLLDVFLREISIHSYR